MREPPRKAGIDYSRPSPGKVHKKGTESHLVLGSETAAGEEESWNSLLAELDLLRRRGIPHREHNASNLRLGRAEVFTSRVADTPIRYPLIASLFGQTTRPRSGECPLADSWDRLCREAGSAVAATPTVGTKLSLLRKRLRRSRRMVDRIVVGDTVYSLRSTLWATEHRVSNGWEFRVEQLSSCFVGHGRTMERARADLEEQVHITFQELYGKRPFELTEDEAAKWSLLERVIDIEAYEAQLLLVLQQIGQLQTARPGPYQIKWLNGRVETVSLAVMPAEFVRYKPGQWFEATVERERATLTLRKVLNIRAREPLTPMSEQESADFIAGLPKSEGSSKPSKDWAKS